MVAMLNTDDKILNIVRNYCETKVVDVNASIEFIYSLRLPPGLLFLKTAVLVLEADYNSVSKFKWFAQEQRFIEEKAQIQHLKVALSSVNTPPKKLTGYYTKYPLATFLLSTHSDNSEIFSDIYSVLKISCLRLSLSMQFDKELRLNTLNNNATTIRHSFEKIQNLTFKNNTIYQTKDDFIQMLNRRNNSLWTLQEQFIRWIEQNIAPITKSHKNPIDIYSRRNQGSVKPLSLSFENDPTDEPSIVSGRTTRHILFKDDEAVEPDCSTLEIYEFTVEPDKPISLETVEFALLYGSRLHINERLLLSLRTNVLTAYELKVFIPAVLSHLDSKLIANVVSSVCLLLTFLMAKNELQLNNIKIGNGLAHYEEGIDLELGCWRRNSVSMPNAVKPEPNINWLYSHTEFVDLPLPSTLITSLKKIVVGKSTTLGDIKAKANVSNDDILGLLNEMMAEIPRRITLAQLRASLFQQIALNSDAGTAGLLLANTEYLVPTPLYYKSASVGTLKAFYQQNLEQLGLAAPVCESASIDIFTGSRLCVNDNQLADFFQTKLKKLNLLSERYFESEFSAIAFQNELTLYTTLILIVCTGHRTRTEFQFEPALLSTELGALCLSDKVQFDDASIRIIPLPDIALAAITEYAKIARRTASIVSDKALNTYLANKSYWHSKAVDSVFLGLIENGNPRAVTSADLNSYLAIEGLNLPLNMFRHRLCSRLSELGTGEFINWVMGHIGAGEHPFNITSTMSLSDIVSYRSVLNDAVAPLKIQVFDAFSNQGLKALPLHTQNQSYLPSYLHIEKMTFKARVRWAHNIFRAYIKTLASDESILSNKSDFIDWAILQATKIRITEDANACIRIVNRMLERYEQNGTNSSEQKWRMPISERLTELPIRFFSDGRVVRELKLLLSNRTMQLDAITEPERALNEIVLSVIIQSSIHFKTLEFISAIKTQRFTTGGFHFFEFTSERGDSRLYIDPITLALLKNAPPIAEQKFSEKKWLKFVARIIKTLPLSLPVKTLNSIDSFSNWLSYSDNNIYEPSVIRSFRINAIHSAPLKQSALVRLLTNSVIPIQKAQLNAPLQSRNYANRQRKSTRNLTSERKFFKKLMINVRARLSKNDSDVTIKNVIPILWAELVNAKSISLQDLIAASATLSDAAIAVLLFLTDVGKRPGKERKEISLTTMTTNHSKVCVSLLDLAQDRNFFEFDEDELTDFYTNVLDMRQLKTRARHAAILRDLHNCTESHFYMASVDWHSIEPNIGKDEGVSFANILTQSEYENAKSLLLNDEYSDEREQITQASILILAYRCGLRRGEIKSLLQQDLNFLNELLYVQSNHFYRLKTINANRRIPITLLLDQSEQQVLEKLIILAQRIDNKRRGRFFNLSNNEYAQRCARVTESLVAVTEDETVRLHDCRHSFASHLGWVGSAPKNSVLYPQIINWCRDNPELFMQRWLQVTTGKQHGQGHKFLNTVSLAIGHSSPLTTLGHYIHEIGLVSYEYQTLYREKSLGVGNEKIGGLLEVTPSNSRKLASRAVIHPHTAIMNRVLTKTWIMPEVLAVQPRHSMALSAKNINETQHNETQQLESWLITLAEFRKMALSDDSKSYLQHPMMKALSSLFRARQHAAPFDLHNENSITLANRHLHSRVRHVVTGRQISKILAWLSSNQTIELPDRLSLLLDCYYGHNGLILDAEQLKMAFLLALNLNLIACNEGPKTITYARSTLSGAKVNFSHNNISITDELYVAGIIISI